MFFCQQKINNLKTEITKENEHSRRTIEYLQSQKQQATSQIKHECLENQYKSSENIFKSVKEELSKFM